MGIDRADAIGRMRIAFRKGLTHAAFVRQQRAAGRPTIRKTVSLADWRTVNQLETKAGMIKYVRKDRFPSEKFVAAISWKISKEYMYVVKVKSVIKLGEPVTERKVNIMSDVPMTPGMVEAKIAESWREWEKYGAELIVGIQIFTAVRRVIE